MPDTASSQIGGLSFTQPLTSEHKDILTPEACRLVAALTDEFRPQLSRLMASRSSRQAEFDAGALPDFLPETQHVRQGDWKVAPLPPALHNRQLEITGPVERKMVINALNADVQAFMADFEDSLSPTWPNIIAGQINLRDAATGQMSYTAPETGKHYQLGENPAVLLCRVRGLHLPEKHVLRNGEPVPGCLLDFALYLFHNAQNLLDRGLGPYFYIPKLQSHLEARWWNQVIEAAQQSLGLPSGTVRVTCLIETLPAVFEMDEILYELKDHIAALNCGRWDYIFSYIKTLRRHRDRVLPDRQQLTMDKPFLNAYSRALIRTCHRRGALAMGGMSNFIPQKDPDLNAAAMAKVEADKELEAGNGHDGAWIAHPGLSEVVSAVFARHLRGEPNQLHVLRQQDPQITAADLLQAPQGDCTEQGMRANIRIAVQYIEAWISGIGCVPIYGLMEDAATAEISRASIWQWLQTGQQLSDGQSVTTALFDRLLDEEMDGIRNEVGEDRFSAGRFTAARQLFRQCTVDQEFADFLTLPGYQQL